MSDRCCEAFRLAVHDGIVVQNTRGWIVREAKVGRATEIGSGLLKVTSLRLNFCPFCGTDLRPEEERPMPVAVPEPVAALHGAGLEHARPWDIYQDTRNAGLYRVEQVQSVPTVRLLRIVEGDGKPCNPNKYDPWTVEIGKGHDDPYLKRIGTFGQTGRLDDDR